jgi:transcriptional regulator with XRE-family HTH domain
MEPFGQRLKRLREAAGYSVGKQFAALIGIKPPSLSELEKGESKEPAAGTLLRAAAILGLDPWYLLTGEGPPVRALQQVSERELRLLMMFRELGEGSRLELETEANRLHALEHPVASKANPFPKVRRRVDA